MTFLNDVIGNILIGLSSNAFLMLVIYWGIKKLSREMPKWITHYHAEQIKLLKFQKAVEWSKKNEN